MAVQVKEPIREIEIRVLQVVVPFVAPDVDIMLKSLIHSLQQSLVPIFNQSISILLSSSFS